MSAVNGVNGHKSGSSDLPQPWKVGLINNGNKKYLTAESFGFNINASGTGLKKKQTWILEQDTSEDVIYIQSQLQRYISADKYGITTCETEKNDKGESEQFVVEYVYAKDGTGRWAFRNQKHGNYLGADKDDSGTVKCFSKTIGDSELWIVQLQIHPQVVLRNVNRKRCAHAKDDEIQFTELNPWGQSSLIVLHFNEGTYALKTFDTRFLHRDGRLVSELEDDAKFTIEIRSGSNSGLAFRDRNGCYLTAVGATATMKSRNKSVSKDELFSLEQSHPQLILKASTGKNLSVKQGTDVSANQDDEEESETFQIEYHKAEDKWSIRTHQNKYWSLEMASGIQSSASQLAPKTMFDLEWQGDGTVAIRASNGNYLIPKGSGSLTASSNTVSEKEKFIVKLVNRSSLVLKWDYGFVGFKLPTSSELVCNKGTYSIISVEPDQCGYCYLKGSSGKYWRLAEDNAVMADEAKPSTRFLLEFIGEHMTLKAPNGCYLKGEQNGQFRATGHAVDEFTSWEY